MTDCPQMIASRTMRARPKSALGVDDMKDIDLDFWAYFAAFLLLVVLGVGIFIFITRP